MILRILDVDGFGDDCIVVPSQQLYGIFSIKMSPWVFGVFQGPFGKENTIQLTITYPTHGKLGKWTSTQKCQTGWDT